MHLQRRTWTLLSTSWYTNLELLFTWEDAAPRRHTFEVPSCFVPTDLIHEFHIFIRERFFHIIVLFNCAISRAFTSSRGAWSQSKPAVDGLNNLDCHFFSLDEPIFFQVSSIVILHILVPLGAMVKRLKAIWGERVNPPNFKSLWSLDWLALSGIDAK